MSTFVQLEPRKFYPKLIPWSILVPAEIIWIGIFIFPFGVKDYQPNYWLLLVFILLIFRRWVDGNNPLLAFSSTEITANTKKYGVWRMPIEHLHRIWIGKQKFRRFFFWHQETDAIFVTSNDDKSNYFQRLDIFKEFERQEIIELVKKVQEMISINE